MGCLRPESVGSNWVEGSVSLYEVLLQFSRPIYIYIYIRYIAWAYEIQMNAKPEKYMSILSDGQAALKAL